LAVGVTVFVDVHAGPSTGLDKDSNIGISRHAVVGFAVLTVPAASAAFLNDRRCADREAALVKDLLVPASVDFSRSPRADAGYPGVLQVRIDVEAN
jgi:hypothetical protein